MSTEPLADRRAELAAFEITVTHAPNVEHFAVRVKEGTPFLGCEDFMIDYASGPARNFKDALRQALHYVSPALGCEVFPDYYPPPKRSIVEKCHELIALVRDVAGDAAATEVIDVLFHPLTVPRTHTHDNDTSTPANGEVW